MSKQCTKQNIAVRKEWSDLSPDMRRSFISACHCMANLPAKSSKSFAPGARNRWDDFVAAHIKVWRDIHFSVWNTIWHRQFVWIMEQALRQECGYDGWMPYFDWSRYLDGPPEKNPLFDGSDTSVSGDGDHRSETCSFVTSGPFSNWTVNLGPVPGTQNCIENPSQDGLAYNPRPLERAFNNEMMQNMTYEKVAETILNVETMQEWVLRIEARGIGLHAMPHVWMGGLQGNIPGSTGDCWFFLHHCMLDRVWSFWQMQDPSKRLYEIPSDQSEFDPFRTGWGPVPPLSLQSTIHISDVFEEVKVQDVMSTTQGQFCYMYD
ncbi:hypothetical protein DOTSEDRAFT_137456 [Dothistroma septosporum NZE10]|uniref:Tyrosinase copper-binding domain-containing protein n=1 Tax=Dothistroma septosporum (strain NZE10 / CBS 128990) TaxID=675120 RepID=N1PDT1_DOTSN|nr:hypothetical protein DOTSEDRAFT_137456 [Dothistroma septosporum NZE10]